MLEGPESDSRKAGQKPLRWRMTIMLIAAALLFGGIFGFQAFMSAMMRKGMASQGMPPQTVSATKAEVLPWQPRLHAVGSLRAVKGTDISAEVPGIVDEIKFESGDDVSAGRILVNLRSGINAAQLHEAQAAATLARADFRRNEELAKAKLVSQATVDSSTAQLRSAEAQVNQQLEGVKRTAVRAPFGGRIGLRVVDVGQYLEAGAKIATLQALDELLVDFFLPQRDIGQLTLGQSVAVSTDAYPGETFTGRVTAIDPKVDPQTRNIAVRSKVANASHKLLPGMYVAVDIDAGAAQRYITLPQTAVVYNSFGSTVYTVQGRGSATGTAGSLPVAKQAFVKVGPTRGDQVAILGGLQEGDTVVTAGQIKLHNGTPVKISNAVQPPNDPDPKPPDEPGKGS